jgi:hypothetical protein
MDRAGNVLAGQNTNAGQADAADAGPGLLALEIDGFYDASSSPAIGDQIGLPGQMPIADLASCMAKLHASLPGFGPHGRRRIGGGSVILPGKPPTERPREFFLKQSSDARLIIQQPLIHLRGDPDRRGIVGVAGFHLDRQITGFGPDGRRKAFWMTTQQLS